MNNFKNDLKTHMEFFVSLLGNENAKNDSLYKTAYSYDATREKREPDIVLFPRNEDDISQILKYCNLHLIPVVPRGAGSGFTGGSIASEGGIVLSLEKHMNKILELDEKNLVVRVEPGVINKQLQNFVESKGLFYPPDPASEHQSTIGGNVSENAGGMRAAKYGITKDYVMALRAIMPNGEIIRSGKRTIKDVAGYNLTGTLVGSEGTLAVISEVTLKLLSKPKLSQVAMGVFRTINDAMNAVFKTMASGVTPVAMEFLDNLTIRAVESKFNKGLPVDAGAILITEVDGNLEEEIKFQIEGVKKEFLNNGCIEFKIAQNAEEAQDLWFARKNASQSIGIYGKKKLNEDITVPRANLPQLLYEIEKVSQKYGFKIPCFGHTGDGNVHTNVMVPELKDVEKGHEAISEIFKITIALDGTLSGEHGIGLSKAPFMNLAFNESEMNIFRSIKKAFDPNNILNPGKMGLGF